MSSVLERVRLEDQRLYIPGQGFVPFGIRRVEKVIRDYDDRLILARHEITGDWVAYVQIGPDRMFPVIGFGPELPHPDDVLTILAKHDTRRHGDKILREIQENNDRIQRELRKRSAEGTEQAVERAEFGVRKYTGEKPKIFVP